MGTKSVSDMSCGEMYQFALALDKAGFDADLVQEIVNSKNNRRARGMYATLTRGENTVVKEYLKCLSSGKPIIIPACDGSHTLASAKKVFKSYIDSDFKNWGLDKRSLATKETAVEVYEIIKNETFAQMLGSLGTDINKRCLTQHQIEIFCEKHFKWLCSNASATLFLFKKEDQFFVARVSVSSDGLDVSAGRFERGSVWGAGGHPRLVVPQLET